MAQYMVNFDKHPVYTRKKKVFYGFWMRCNVHAHRITHVQQRTDKVSSLLTGLFKLALSLLIEICHYLKGKTVLNVRLMYLHFSSGF